MAGDVINKRSCASNMNHKSRQSDRYVTVQTSVLVSLARLVDENGDEDAVMEATAVAKSRALVTAEGVPLVMTNEAEDLPPEAVTTSPEIRPLALRKVSSSLITAAELAETSEENTRPETATDALAAP